MVVAIKAKRRSAGADGNGSVPHTPKKRQKEKFGVLRKTDKLFFVTQSRKETSVWVLTALPSKLFHPKIKGRHNRFLLQRILCKGKSTVPRQVILFPERDSVAYFKVGGGLSILSKNRFSGDHDEVFATSELMGYFGSEEAAKGFASRNSHVSYTSGSGLEGANRGTVLWSFTWHHPKMVAMSEQDLRRLGICPNMVQKR
jgi:hypothetical protein